MQFLFLYKEKLRLRALKWHSKVISKWVAHTGDNAWCVPWKRMHGVISSFSLLLVFEFVFCLHTFHTSFFFFWIIQLQFFHVEPCFFFSYFSGCLPSPWDSESKGMQLWAGADCRVAGGCWASHLRATYWKRAPLQGPCAIACWELGMLPIGWKRGCYFMHCLKWSQNYLKKPSTQRFVMPRKLFCLMAGIF